MYRSICITSAALFVLVLGGRAQSQRWYQQTNPALSQHTIDPAALGEAPAAFVQYGLPDDLGWSAMAGVRFGGGVFRTSFKNGWHSRVVGLGYARTLATKGLGPFGTLASGVDLAAGYNTAYGSATADRAARLSLPFSIRWGSASRLSFAPLLAPFTEIGSRGFDRPDCETCFSWTRAGLLPTRSTGLTAGAELTAWRTSFEVAQRDVWTHHGRYEARFSAGLRWHF
jgi:hypothetical protein